MPKNDTRNTAQNRVYGASGWETLARPPSNDPKHPPCKNVSQGRIYYDDLSAVTPGTGEDPTIELPDAAARSDLEIIWKSGDVTFQIVIDHSGSMGIENKMENVKVAAKLLVDLAEFDRTTIGVIKFDDQVAVVQPLTAIDSQATKDNIKAQIDTIQPEDLTAIGDAAQKALDDLVAFGAEDTDRVVYLLTNGQSNTGSDPYLVIPGYQDADICMNTFGHGSDVNADMLRDLAEETGCEYHFSPTDMNELTQVFQDAQLLASPSVGIATDSATVQNDFPSLLPIYVDTTLGWLNLVVTYEGAPGDADLSLFDPIAAEHAANCSYSGTGTVCVFGVDSPDPGYWTLQAQATGSDVHLTYRASGSGDNVIPCAASVTSLAGGDVQYPTPIVLLAVLGKEWPITGAVVRATVQRPDGTVASLSLSDDGNSPDANIRFDR